MEHYSAIKKEQNLTFYNLDGPWGYYAKWNKLDRGRQIPYYFTYVWNLKNKIYKQNRNRLIDKQNRLTVVRGDGGRGPGWKKWRN